MLRIEIKNIQEVARQKSTLVNTAALIAPRLVQRAVEQAVAVKIRSELKKMGVDADVRVEPDVDTP